MNTACLFCDSNDLRDGYAYHELFACETCFGRIGIGALDQIGIQIGKRDRRGRLPPERERQRIIAAAVKKYRVAA